MFAKKCCIIWVALVLSLAILSRVEGAVICPDDRYIMPMMNGHPWGAVGFLNNGCTATLIDPQHILAAAHCFVFDKNGAWQTKRCDAIPLAGLPTILSRRAAPMPTVPLVPNAQAML